MRNTRTRTAVLAMALTAGLAALSACGDDEPAAEPGTEQTAAQEASASVTVEDPWVRATEGAEDTTMTAAFMVLDNAGSADVSLTGAHTDVAGRTELHEMVMQDGKSAMQAIEGGLELTAGKGQLLQPGGTHVMLMDVAQPLAPGDEVELVLEFSDGSEQTVTAPVKAFTEEEGHYHAPGTPEHTH